MPDLASLRPGSGGAIFVLMKSTVASSKTRLPILDRHLSDPSRMEVRARVKTNGTDVMTAVRLEEEDVVTDNGADNGSEGVSCVVKR